MVHLRGQLIGAVGILAGFGLDEPSLLAGFRFVWLAGELGRTLQLRGGCDHFAKARRVFHDGNGNPPPFSQSVLHFGPINFLWGIFDHPFEFGLQIFDGDIHIHLVERLVGFQIKHAIQPTVDIGLVDDVDRRVWRNFLECLGDVFRVQPDAPIAGA